MCAVQTAVTLLGRARELLSSAALIRADPTGCTTAQLMARQRPLQYAANDALGTYLV